jgi:hypothetical protein
LWRFAPVEHAVVAYDPDTAKPRAVFQRDGVLKAFGGGHDIIKMRSPGRPPRDPASKRA